MTKDETHDDNDEINKDKIIDCSDYQQEQSKW